MGNSQSWCIGGRSGVISKPSSTKQLKQSANSDCVIDVVPDICKSSQTDLVKVSIN